MANDISNQIHLEIVTPRGRALSVVVDEVTAPSVRGEFGVMPGHLPLLAALRTGIVSYKVNGELKHCAVGRPGFAEAGANKLLLLTDEYVERDKIDPVIIRTRLAEVQGELAKIELAKLDDADIGGESRAERMKFLVDEENWLAVQLELYGDAPPATMRPYEEWGPPPPTPDDEIPADDEAAS